jgi:hypothetical protein
VLPPAAAAAAAAGEVVTSRGMPLTPRSRIPNVPENAATAAAAACASARMLLVGWGCGECGSSCSPCKLHPHAMPWVRAVLPPLLLGAGVQPPVLLLLPPASVVETVWRLALPAAQLPLPLLLLLPPRAEAPPPASPFGAVGGLPAPPGLTPAAPPAAGTAPGLLCAMSGCSCSTPADGTGSPSSSSLPLLLRRFRLFPPATQADRSLLHCEASTDATLVIPTLLLSSRDRRSTTATVILSRLPRSIAPRTSTLAPTRQAAEDEAPRWRALTVLRRARVVASCWGRCGSKAGSSRGTEQHVQQQ